MTAPVSRAVLLLVLASASMACGGSSSTGFTGKGGVDGEAGEGNASGGKGGSAGEGADSGLGGEGGEGASDGSDPSCSDAIENGSETDVDCGGPDCQPCVTGEKCDEASDCKSEVCDPDTKLCLKAKCGDGVVNRVAEACDDGEDNSDTEAGACRTTCALATCGDGAVDDGEECDDGELNSDTADACRTACKVATCGDGIVDGEEECDDGELNGPTAPCRDSCTKAFCGDGIQDADEECDRGELNSDTAPDSCRTSCTLASCGDAVIDEGESCDDGNQNDDLTCAADCQSPCGGSAGHCDGETSSYCASDGSAVLTEHCDPLQGLSCDAESGLCAGSCAERNLGPGAVGCDFRATDAKQLDGYTSQAMRIVLTNATATDASVKVTQGASDVATFTVPANSRYQQALGPVSALRAGSTTVAVDSAFRVRSTQPLSVFQHVIPGSSTGDSSVLMPVRHWGTEYVAASATGLQSGLAFVSVIAKQDDTTVTLKAPVAVTANAEIGVNADGTGTIVLDAEDVLQVVASGDLTGALLSSDKPVQVFGGSGCAQMPIGTSFCDHLSEVMPPIPSLGTAHVVVPPARHGGGERATFVRVISTEADTALTYLPALANAPSSIAAAGQYVEIGPLTAAVSITSSSKVLVAQYYPGTNYSPSSSGDPSMLVLPPVPAFLSAYDFSASSGYNDYISVLLPSNATATLDGAPLAGFTAITDVGFQYVNVPIGGTSPHRVECSAGCRVDLLGVNGTDGYWHGVGRAYSGY